MNNNNSPGYTYLALLSVIAGVFIAAADQTVVATILPSVMIDLKVQITELDKASWTITGYLLGYLGAMPLVGRLSDNWGHRRLFVISMIWFMAGSIAVALASSLTWLIVARIFQSIGAGALLPISIAVVGHLFPSGRRAVPLGLIGASAEIGGVIGPLWGGVIVRFLEWTWVFWVNLPLGLIVIVMVLVFTQSTPKIRSRVDYLGGVLVASSLVALTLGLARVVAADVLMVGYFVAFAATLALFILRERTAGDHAIIPPAMFKVRAFAAANGTHLLVGAALIIVMISLPLMANTALGLTPLDGGMLLMRMTVSLAVGAIIGGIACRNFDVRLPATLGLVLAIAGFLLMSNWSFNVKDPIQTLHLAIVGLGFGLLVSPITLAATESVREENRGVAAATVMSMRMIGMALGMAALTTWGTDRFQELVSGIAIPFAIAGHTGTESQNKVQEFDTQLRMAGMTLFNEFFVIAMVICLVALIPAACMAWDRFGTRD